MITIYQGEALTLYVEVLDDDKNPVDFTGATAKIVLYNSPRKAPDLEMDLVVVSAGLLSVALDVSDTEKLRGLYQAEVRVWFASGEVRTVAENQITIVRSGFV